MKSNSRNLTFYEFINVIGAIPDVSYEKGKHLLGENNILYIFSDGVYEVEKSDGSMWQFNEFKDFMAKSNRNACNIPDQRSSNIFTNQANRLLCSICARRGNIKSLES